MKIKEILVGEKKRQKRGSRLRRLKGKSLISRLREGGKVFPDAIPFDHDMIPGIMKSINGVLAKTNSKALPIGSGATPTSGKISGDLDMIVDLGQLKQHFKMPDAKDADVRKKLRQVFDLSGFKTAQTGTSVHVEVPMADHTHQVDIMVVADGEAASKIHTHNIPQGSKFKGLNKMIALAKLAKNKGMKFSPYRGVVNRETNELITNNLDKIAKTLIGPNSSGKDIGSVESIVSALGKEGPAFLADLRSDTNWKELD
tara:strand:- start:2938 stop:3708 length:771 start_codon:yes stop_codon:yes gene_type:complete